MVLRPNAIDSGDGRCGERGDDLLGQRSDLFGVADRDPGAWFVGFVRIFLPRAVRAEHAPDLSSLLSQ
jgi:hypothetical protein